MMYREVMAQALSLPPVERRQIYIALRESLRPERNGEDPSDFFSRVRAAVEKAVGCDVVGRSRTRDATLGRCILANLCLEHGLGINETAHLLELHRVSIYYHINAWRAWKETPGAFRLENGILRQVREELGNDLRPRKGD